MHYDLAYDFCAFAVLTLVFLVFFFKRSLPTLQTKCFIYILIATTSSTIFDILGSWASMNFYAVPFLLTYIFNALYITSLTLISFFFALYALSVSYHDFREVRGWRKFLFLLPIIFFFICMLSNPITKTAFYFDENGLYHRGFLQPLFYVISFYYIIYGFLRTKFFKVITGNFQKLSSYMFFVIASIFSLFQFFVPDKLITNFGMALCVLVLFFSIHNPDNMLDSTTLIFNAKAFTKMFDINTRYAKKYTLVLINIEDTNILNQVFGLLKMNTLFKNFATFLNTMAPQRTYYLRNAFYAVILDTRSESDIDYFIRQIDKRCETSWICEDSPINISVRTLCIDMPDDAPDIDTVYNYVNYLRRRNNSRKWRLTAKEISLHNSTRVANVRKAIKNAIKNDKFLVYFQPIYSVAAHKITSAEALIRLKDDDLGFIPPAEFIPIAEQDGTILRIGEIVLEKVCEFIKKTNVLDLGIEYIEINLSVIQCLQDDIADKLLNIINSYGINPKNLNFEITETAANNSPRLLVKNLSTLRENGISISLDDFGTGYSNISSLLTMPIDIIKFDKSMVDAATFSKNGKIIFGGSVAMIKQMNLTIVAEGIETQEQVDLLSDTNIDYLQGYYFSQPLAPTDFLTYLENFKFYNRIG